MCNSITKVLIHAGATNSVLKARAYCPYALTTISTYPLKSMIL